MSLNKKELESLRKDLESKREDLVRKIREDVAERTSTEDNYPDTADAATRLEEERELVGQGETARAMLADVDRALAKFDAGTYGVSEKSGKPIPIERLRAIPWARLTAEEEERRERR